MLTTITAIADPHYRRELGDGLILRWSTAHDIEDIAYLAGSVFRQKADAPFNVQMGNLMRELLSGTHPVTSAEDVAVVEDTKRGEHALVCMTFLWRQQWAYEGIPFAIGRPEIVATDTGYRNRGLVRAVFELVHARSETEGHLAQGITGIPYFYRQFGYEYALDLDERSTLYIEQVPKSTEDGPEPYSLREATLEDIPLLQRLYNRQKAVYSVTTPIDERWWRYQIQTRNKIQDDGFWHIGIIVDKEGNSVGYVVLPMVRSSQSIVVSHLTVAHTVNLQAVMPSLLRSIQAQRLQVASSPGVEPARKIVFTLGRKHAAYQVLGKELTHSTPYAWYVRVPDLPKFIRHIAPALERRLANSALASYSGSLILNFYRGGLRLVFEKGHLAVAEHWRSSLWNNDENAGFPPLVFLQLLFGRRSLDQLRYAFPDVFANDEVELLLKVLFPSSPSWAIPLG
jgi:predicted N-acetyltransferase YhbS